MSQLAITLDLDGLDAELVEETCFGAGAVSVVLTDQRDDAILEPAPGEVRLWPATRLQAIFMGSIDDAVTVDTVCEHLFTRSALIEHAVIVRRARSTRSALIEHA